MSNGFILWLLGAVMAFFLGVALANLWIAERDERRWRQSMEQARIDGIIRKHAGRDRR